MMPESAAAPVAGEGGVVPGAEAGFVDVNRAAAAAAAVVGEGLDALVVEVFVEARVAVVVEAGEVVEAHVPAAAVVRVVAGEDVHQRADGDFEDVARAGGVDFEAGAIRTHTDDAATAMLERFAIGAGGLHEAEVATRDVKPAVDAETEAVRGVIGGAVLVTKGDVLHEDVLLLRDAIVIGINELAEVRRMHEVEPVVIPHEPARGIDLAKDLRLIRAAIAIEIAQADDATTLRIAAQRAVSIRRNVKRAIWLRGDEDGVVRRGAIRKKRDLKALRDLHILQNGRFLLRREFHDLRRDVAFLGAGIIRLVILLLLLGAELRRDGFDARSFELHLADAGPAAVVVPCAGDDDFFGLLGFQGMAWGDGNICHHFAIDLDLVLVGLVFSLPHDFETREVLRLLELQRERLRLRTIRGAPACAFIAIDGFPGVIARLSAARGRLDAGGVFRCGWRLRSLDRLRSDKGDFVLSCERRQVVRREFVTGPKQAACDEIEVTCIGDGLRVVPDGRAEAAGTGFFVRPGDDVFDVLRAAVLVFDRLLAHRERMRVKEVHVVVELLFDRGPIGQRLRDRVLLIDKGDRDGLLRAMRV